MCLQCCAETVTYGKFAPGWYLVRATRTVEGEMDAGEWGLVRSNDPDVFFATELTIPTSIEQFRKLADKFIDELWVQIPVGASLHKALSEVTFPYAVRKLWVQHGKYGRCTYEERLYLYLAWFVAQNVDALAEYAAMTQQG